MKYKKLIFFTLFFLIFAVSLNAARLIKTSFNAGEFSPRLYGRIDLAKYANAVKTMDNFLPMPHGGATRRPGFQHIAEVKDSDDEVRLIPFEYSNEQTYMLEFGDLYVRFYKNGGQIWTSDSYTKALLHMDGDHNSTTFTDDGATGHTWTAYNGAKLKEEKGKWGTEAGKFDGVDNYIDAADHADWYFASGAWTIDFWLWLNNTISTDQGLFHQQTDADNWHALSIYSVGGSEFIRFFVEETADGGVPTRYLEGQITYAQQNKWTHIAVVYDTTNMYLFIDGNLMETQASPPASFVNYTGSFTVGRGRTTDGSMKYLKGFIDEFRVSKGSARWTADFNVPTGPYPFTGAGGGSAVYELVSPYSHTDLNCLDYTQSADVMYLVHPDYAPRTLSRTTDTSWAFADFTDGFISTKWPPFLDINISSTTLTPSATSGSITLTASAALFDSDMVGGWFALHDGYAEVTGFTSTTVVDADVINNLSDTAATADWWEGAWSDYQGYPRSAAFFEDRLAFGGSRRNVDRIHMSETSDYNDFRDAAITGGTAAASDTINIVLNSRQVNGISWFAPTRKFLVGTTGGEWWIGGATSDEVLDATSIPLAHQDTSIGCKQCVKPIIIGNTVIFAQRLGKILREYFYKWEVDQYIANDLSILSDHFNERFGIVEMAYQQTPHQIIWLLTSGGRLLSVTYIKEHDVVGWAEHTLGGTDVEIKSIAVIEGNYEDELWAAVSRTIDGSAAIYIERLAPIVKVETDSGEDTNWALEDAFFVDSGLTYRGESATTISGLDHLEGESVVALADGVAVSGLTVSSGSITLSSAASVVHIGLNYNSDLETLWPVFQDEQGPMLGPAQRITNLYMMLYKTSGGQYGDGSDDLINIDYTHGQWDESTDYYSGISSDLSVSSSFEGRPTIFIRQSEPLPMTITALIMEVE